MVPGFSGQSGGQGRELPSGGTACGDECHRCGRRWSHMVYLNYNERLCFPCNAKKHEADAKAERV